ncbi:hypothetical protein SCD75_00225 (plasmid) [Prescottella equi]|uniref:Uncharacterized protein n=1 Tax=Rhodococcus hoagii TaxID=43767 RepID=A0A1Z1UZ69_RHOHA|nr:hypothetical protein pVAPN1572_0590 [Prescottella equi]WQB72167.1 hypothetical protein SCD75_00225 [Prescottella equi]
MASLSTTESLSGSEPAHNVLPLPLQVAPAHLTCDCGSAWWDTSVCIEDGKVTGYSVPVRCTSCGRQAST